MSEYPKALGEMITDVTGFGDALVARFDPLFPSSQIHERRLSAMKNDAEHAYAHGAYAEAFKHIETYIEFLEDVEIEYSEWEKTGKHGDVHSSMQGDLELVLTAPHEIIVEKKAHIQELEQMFAGLHTQDNSMMDRVVYRSLKWLELVLILVLIEMIIGFHYGLLPSDERHRLLFMFIGSIGVFVFILRQTKHKRGLLVALCVIVCSCRLLL